jgi:ribosomal protein S18 acetylase RimI-like enzyme
LLVATDDKGNFLGYLLYGISGKKMLAYIVHLCVHPEHRKKKVATILVHTDGLEARLWASDPIHTAR